MVANLINDFWVYYNSVVYHQVGNELTDNNSFVKNRKPPLLIISNASPSKRHGERILINLLMQSMANLIQHIKCTSDNLLSLRFIKESRVFQIRQVWDCICVHLCLSVVKTCVCSTGGNFD